MATASKESLQESRTYNRDELAEPTYPGHVFTPAVDIFESADAISVVADMPGVQPEDLKIDLEENILTLSGKVSESEQSEEEQVLQEYLIGSYYRRFSISNEIDQSKIDASLKDGVVHIVLPKADRAKPRQIAVRPE